jgi:uncharacterized beta-barrel protein YwiB (DUF1934 family)
MKTFNLMLLILGVLAFSKVNSFAQYTAADISVKVNKQTKKLEIFKKSDGSNITAAFDLNKATLDIFDKAGDYAGTVELKDWTIPLQEFSADEIVKVSIIILSIKENKKLIELKDIRLQL